MDIIKNKEEKITFIGISLGGISTIESAVAVLDRNLKIITLDKLFSMSDVKYFLDKFPAKQNAVILVSVPENATMISSKWKYNSRTYDVVNFEEKIKKLESLVKELESGEVNLDDAIDKYTEAMKLAKECNDTLNNISDKVNKILLENGKLEEFKVEES